MIKNYAQMESKWIQKQAKLWSNIDAKINAKINAKSMQNGTLKRRVGGRGVSPLSSTQSPYLVFVSQYHIPQCAVDSYIRPQRNPQNGPSAPLRGCAAGSMGYRLFRRPPIFGLCVWGLDCEFLVLCLGFWIVGLRFYVLCRWGLQVCPDCPRWFQIAPDRDSSR